MYHYSVQSEVVYLQFFNNRSMSLIEKSLDTASLRQNLISNNIANAETPGYKRKDVRFETVLSKAMGTNPMGFVGRRTDIRHFEIRTRGIRDPMSKIVEESSYRMLNNENNVDLDYEMAELAKNALKYNTLVQRMNDELSLYRTAIQSGGR